MRAHVLDADGVILTTIVVEALGDFPDLRLIDAEIGGQTGDRIVDGAVIPGEVIMTTLARHITVLALRNRFTQAEKVGIDLASIDNPAADMAVRQVAAGLRVAQADLAAAAYIDLDRPDTRVTIQGIETNGLVGVGRALEILDNEIQPHERPVR